MPRISAFSIINLTFLISIIPSVLFGQVQEKELLLRLDVSPDYASISDDMRLTEAIIARLPDTFVIRNDSVTPDWSIRWEKAQVGAPCTLSIFSETTQSKIELGPKATEKEIDSAASRIVWISSFSNEESEEESKKKATPAEEKGKKENEMGKKEPAEIASIEKEETPPENTPKKETSTNEDVLVDPPPKLLESSKPNYVHIGASLSLMPGFEFNKNNTPAQTGVPMVAFNLIGGSHLGLRGFELGFLWNHKSQFVEGVQIAMGANISDGPLRGAQFAFVNIADQKSKGLQLGLANFSEDLDGLQLGLVNIGAHSKVQVGLINISEKSRVSLGIFNLSLAYPLRPVFWMGSDGQLTVGVQHGSE